MLGPQVQRAAVRRLWMHALQLCREAHASPQVEERACTLAGEAKGSGRKELLALTNPIAWLPLPVEIDPMMLAWFEPQQLRPLWSELRKGVGDGEAGGGVPKAGRSHTMLEMVRLGDAARAIKAEAKVRACAKGGTMGGGGMGGSELDVC